MPRWWLPTIFATIDGEQLLTDCVAALERGENLIIFPEGTRTASDGALSSSGGGPRRGAGRCNVTPVLIRCRPVMLARDVRWWKLPASRSQFSIEVQRRYRHSTIYQPSGY